MKSLSISQANQSYDQKNRSFFNSNSPSKKQMMIAKKDAELLITTRPLFSKIWKQIVKLFCSTGGDLNIRTFQLIYDKFQHQIDEIYQIQTIEDFFEVFDPDKDGQLNEDEIILIFQVAKEKMNKVAQSLLDTKQYSLNRELMLCIEHFEKDIVEYQNFFRQRIYQNNLQQYNAIGDEVLDQFYLEWDLKFKQFDKQKNEEISQLNQQHIDQISELEDYLSKDVNTCKIKPKIQLKQIQKQEKLVAVVQRVEEAINFREELKKMELYEMERLNVALKNSNDKKRQKLREQQVYYIVYFQYQMLTLLISLIYDDFLNQFTLNLIITSIFFSFFRLKQCQIQLDILKQKQKIFSYLRNNNNHQDLNHKKIN